MLKVYYRHTIQTPYREAGVGSGEGMLLRPPHSQKAEAVAIKEETPLDYMPYITEEFERATGLHLNGLPEFTLWINEGATSMGCLSREARSGSAPT